jgi:ligand-binding sensor domain-containing protein/two-component sensor histidine kinase
LKAPAWLFVLALLFPFWSQSQTLYQLDQYTLKDGLPQSQVNCITQDDRGRLWVGTNGGLAIFDGFEFIAKYSADGLVDDRVNAIFADHENIWIGTAKGLMVFDGSSFLLCPPSENLIVQTLLKDPYGVFWIGTDQGLFQTTNPLTKSWEKVIDGESIFDLLSYNQFVAVATDSGVILIRQNGELTRLSTSIGIPYANALGIDNAGDLLVGTYGKGVLRSTGETLTPAHEYDNVGKVVFDICSLENGTTYFGTLKNGVVVSKDNQIKQAINTSNGLSVNTVNCIFVDRWQNIWFGTSGGGLVRMSTRPFAHFGRKEGLTGDPVYAVTETRDGKIVASCADQGLFYLTEGRFESLNIRPGIAIKSLLADSRGYLWIGTEGNGILLQTPDSLYTIDASYGLGGAFVRCMHEDGKGNVWVGTAGGGITRFEVVGAPQHWKTNLYSEALGLAEGRITDIASDHRGNIWYGTSSHGLGVILPSGDMINFTKEQGLCDMEIRSLEMDALHTLWIAGGQGSVCSMDLAAETFEIRTVQQQGALANIYTLQIDRDQNLWIGTSKGVYRWTFDQNRMPAKQEHFGSAEGFEGIEVCTNASCITRSGNVWFGTVAGVSARNPAADNMKSLPPYVYVDNPHLFYRAFKDLPIRHFVDKWDQMADTLVLTADQNHLSFDLHAVHLQFPEDILFSHYLEGLEDTWSPPGRNTTLSYSNLQPGWYTLHVRACIRGENCALAKQIHIQILAPFWQKSWFIATALITSLLLILFIFWSVIRRIKQRSIEKNARLRLERDVLDLEQKALRLQMNPHFIFNTLNSIQGLIATKDNKTARLYLSRFSKLMRQILENSREDHITLDEEFESLKNYIELQQFTHSVEISFEVDCEESLLDHPVPPLLLQPFVENAILHGLVAQGGGSIHIRAVMREKLVEVVVEDDGIGRAASAEKRPYSHKSAGLEVTRSRLSLLHNEDGPDNFFTVSDVEPHGTRVTILLPYQDE